MLDAAILTDDQTANAAAQTGMNPADLTRQINKIQTQLTTTARAKAETLTAAMTLDLEALQPSINRSTSTKRKPSRAQHACGTTNPHELTPP